MSDLDDELKKLTKGSDLLICGPDTLDQLREKGVQVDSQVPDLFDVELDRLFEEKRALATELVDKIPRVLAPDRPAIQGLYDDIRHCILFGLNGAAITLCANLVEFALKYVSQHWDDGTPKEYNADQRRKVDNMDLGSVVQRALSLKILEHAEADGLRDYKRTIRDPYNHYNLGEITKDVVARDVKLVNIKTGQHETLDMAAIDHPHIRPHVKKWLDKTALPNVFEFSFNTVSILLARLDARS